MAQWLSRVGALEDIRAETFDNETCLSAAMEFFRKRDHPHHHPSMLPWVILNGGANDESGHVDQLCFVGRPKARKSLVAELQETVQEYMVFTRLILPAICIAPGLSLKRIRLETSPESLKYSPLSRLNGLEMTVVLLVADYVGVVRGRCLRNLRELTRTCSNTFDDQGVELESDDEYEWERVEMNSFN